MMSTCLCVRESGRGGERKKAKGGPEAWVVYLMPKTATLWFSRDTCEALIAKDGITPSSTPTYSLFQWVSTKGLSLEEATCTWFSLLMGLHFHTVKGRHIIVGSKVPSAVEEGKGPLPTTSASTMGHNVMAWFALGLAEDRRVGDTILFPSQATSALCVTTYNLIISEKKIFDCTSYCSFHNIIFLSSHI